MSKTIETCDGRYGVGCGKQAQVFWPVGGEKWCIEHAPLDSGWLPADDLVLHEGDADDLCRNCNEPWPCTQEKERILVQRTTPDPSFNVECLQCREEFQSLDYPRHKASSRCQSGGRPHCDCDLCF